MADPRSPQRVCPFHGQPVTDTEPCKACAEEKRSLPLYSDLDEAWRHFFNTALRPHGRSLSLEKQIDIRRGYYCGAAAMYDLLTVVVPTLATEAEGLAALERIGEQLIAFTKAFEAGER